MQLYDQYVNALLAILCIRYAALHIEYSNNTMVINLSLLISHLV